MNFVYQYRSDDKVVLIDLW